MTYKKIIAAISLALILGNQAHGSLLVKAAQSATVAATSPSRGLVIGYRTCQALFWLAVVSPIIDKLFGFSSINASSNPLTGNRLSFIKKICSQHNFDHPINFRIAIKEEEGIENAEAVGNDTIVMIREKPDANNRDYVDLEQALEHKKDGWSNSNSKTKEREQRKIRETRIIVKHEIGHLKKAHASKILAVQIFSNFVMTYLFNRYLLQGYFKNLFAQPTTKLGLLKLFLLYVGAVLGRNIFAESLILNPYSRSCERAADTYAIKHTSNYKDLEATAESYEKLFDHLVNEIFRRKGSVTPAYLQLGSFVERHFLLRPSHPPLSERIANFRVAAQKLREKKAQNSLPNANQKAKEQDAMMRSETTA